MIFVTVDDISVIYETIHICAETDFTDFDFITRFKEVSR